MKMIFGEFEDVYFETDEDKMYGCTKDEFLRFLKGRFSNIERFKQHFVHGWLTMIAPTKVEGREEYDPKAFETSENLCNFFLEFFETAKPFTFEEAFKLPAGPFQSLVFSSIDIPNMIKELGSKKIADAQHVTKQRFYNQETGEREEENDQVIANYYETHEINGSKLGLRNDDKLYAVRCTCTSTSKEHWIWIADEHKNDPLAAIAATFSVHKELIPYVSCLKRQGDVLVVELKEEVNFDPNGEQVPLTKEQYFDWVVAQS